MVKLYDNDTGQYLGRIEDEELQFLIDNLEEESLTDTDYYINRGTLELLKEKGMNENFAKLIESAMGGGDEIEIRYERVT
jgi:sporulation protein YlmC with PRC-barrel domain